MIFCVMSTALPLTVPIENISRDLKSVEDLSFSQTPHRPSKVREIAQLQAAAALLRNSLQSFSAFAPVDAQLNSTRGSPAEAHFFLAVCSI